MAEALLRDGVHARNLEIAVNSAGIGAVDGKPADPLAVKLMRERDTDISHYRSAQFSSVVGSQSDLILVMTKQMRDTVVSDYPQLHGRVYRLGHWENTDISDPHMRGEAAFRKAFKLIESGVGQWLERIV